MVVASYYFFLRAQKSFLACKALLLAAVALDTNGSYLTHLMFLSCLQNSGLPSSLTAALDTSSLYSSLCILNFVMLLKSRPPFQLQSLSAQLASAQADVHLLFSRTGFLSPATMALGASGSPSWRAWSPESPSTLPRLLFS